MARAPVPITPRTAPAASLRSPSYLSPSVLNSLGV